MHLLGYARGERAERREKGKEGAGPSSGEEGSWARVGFSWARDLGWVSREGGPGPGLSFGLGSLLILSPF